MSEITPEQVRSLRRLLGLTQAQLAERIGCSKLAISYWETGRRSPTGLYAREVQRLLVQAKIVDVER